MRRAMAELDEKLPFDYDEEKRLYDALHASDNLLDYLDGEARLKQIEQMTNRIHELQLEAEKNNSFEVQSSTNGDDEKREFDARSVYIGNVDYGATPDELQKHFENCGSIVRVTIMCNKYGGPKGFAYMQFADANGMNNALDFDNSEFRGRQLKVCAKRTNVPGMSNTPSFLNSVRGGENYRGRGRPSMVIITKKIIYPTAGGARGRGYRGGNSGSGSGRGGFQRSPRNRGHRDSFSP